MKYCTRCVQPDTRPGIYFSAEGVCGACLWEEEKARIDWPSREEDLRRIVRWAKSHNAAYDCVVGVSGGKDSTFQALYARDTLGLRPLLVNCEPGFNTDLGRKNLENLKQLGFDTVSLRINPKVSKELIRKDFWAILNISRPQEYPLYSSACIIADRFDIPLIIQGEKAGQALGASKDTGTGGDAFNQFKLNTVKADPADIYIADGITETDLFLFRPPLNSLRAKGTKSIFLSYYAKEWSQPHNALYAMKHGMQLLPQDSNPYEIGMHRRFLGLDYYYRPVNQLFKYIKLGFGMTTDLACYDLRDNLISQDEAVFLVKELDGLCSDAIIQDFCNYIGCTVEEFWKHANTFRGPMWNQERQGKWRLASPIWKQLPVQGNYTVKAIMDRLGM